MHLCGDQHLAVVVKHGIREFGDGPYGFTSPALVNTIYGRWWHPLDEKPGPNPVPDSPLPWTGEFQDGLGNKISMLAYANPEDISDEKKRADGYGIVRFDKTSAHGHLRMLAAFQRRDGRATRPSSPAGRSPWRWTTTTAARSPAICPSWSSRAAQNPVVQVIEEDDRRNPLHGPRPGDRFQPRVYSAGKHTVKIGRDRPDVQTLTGLEPDPREAGRRTINL